MSAVLDEIVDSNGLPVFGLSVSWPGSTLQYATSSYTSATAGHHYGKVTSWGTLDYKVSDRGGQPPAVVFRATIDDTDRTIARIYSGTRANDVRGSAATFYLMTPNVGSTEVLFTGVVSKVSFPEPFVAEITMRVQDDQLQRKTPRGWAQTPQVWPNADPAVYEQTAGLIWGTYDASRVRTGPGMIPAPLVDKIIFRYGGWAGTPKTLTRVYKDGVEQASNLYGSTAPWTDGAFERVTIHGREYTCVRFAADQGDAEITIDCVGYEADGDGSGAVITNPVTQWETWLSNFVLATYTNGSWNAAHSLLDVPNTIRRYIGANDTGALSLGAQGAIYSDRFLTGLEITSKLCTSWRLYSFWTPAGKLSLGMDDPFAVPYTGTRYIWSRDDLGPFSYREDDYPITSRILVRMCKSPSDDSFFASFEVVNFGASSETQETIDVEWSATS